MPPFSIRDLIGKLIKRLEDTPYTFTVIAGLGRVAYTSAIVNDCGDSDR